jgi:trk system potassium uptake protein
MRMQVAVIGLGPFGTSVANALFQMGHHVLALDIDAKKVQNISTQVTHAIQADATNEAILRELGISNFDVGIVTIGSTVENSVLITILLKKLGIRHVIARAGNELHGSILEKIGADRVVYPERETGARTAHGISLRDIMDYIPMGRRYGVVKLEAPPTFAGQSLSELGFGPGGKKGVAVLLIQREQENEVIVTPSRSETIHGHDMLILAGDDDDIEKVLLESRLQ